MTYGSAARAPSLVALNLPMAAFAAMSVAFALFAMPDALFSDLVGASGIPGLVPAAQPPLGFTARIAAMAFAGIATFFAIWGLFALVDRVSPGVGPDYVPEPSFDAPRVRRADAHPDAPTRRPIFAGSDFGEPIEPVEPVAVAAPRPAPKPQPATEPKPAPELKPAPVAIDPEPVVAEPAPEPKPAPARKLPSFLELEQPPEPMAEVEPQPAPQPAPAEPKPAGISALFEEPAEPDQSKESISSLMQRLEGGIERKPRPSRPAGDGVDARLRSAIGDLQKMAAKSAGR